MNSNPVHVFIMRARSAARVALKATAERVRQDVRPRIDAGKTPDGASQKQNARSTALAKAKKSGHTTPLHGKQGHLRAPDRYRLEVKGGGEVVIYPPPDRANVIQWLRNKGYEWFSIPSEAAKWLDEELKKRLP